MVRQWEGGEEQVSTHSARNAVEGVAILGDIHGQSGLVVVDLGKHQVIGFREVKIQIKKRDGRGLEMADSLESAVR